MLNVEANEQLGLDKFALFRACNIEPFLARKYFVSHLVLVPSRCSSSLKQMQNFDLFYFYAMLFR